MTQNNVATNRNLTTSDNRNLDTLVHRAPATDDLLALADWLGTNGAAHLSPIERIELAERLITRRRFLIGAGALGLGVITGCGPEEEAAAPTATTVATRTFRNADGSDVEIPANPQRVVMLHDALGLLPLWELGFRDFAGSVGAFDGNGNPYFRGMAEQGFEPTDVEFISNYAEPDLESIAAVDPDLIVAFEWQTDLYDLLNEIAPTVLMVDPNTVTLQEGMLNFGRLVGFEEEVERLEAEYQQALADLREAAGDPSEIVISKIETAAGGGAELGQFYIDAWGDSERILREVGFARPAPQLAIENERAYYSVELLPEHDADLLMRITYSSSDPEAEEENTQAIKGSPLWAQLNAVQKGQAVDVNGDLIGGFGYSPNLTYINTLMDLLEGLDTSGDLSTVDITTPTPAEE
ncbi:MAG: ABC transporter substrate-binding protein [Chloroflexota bacterium]